MKPEEVAIAVLGSILTILLLLALTSVFLQMCASQTYTLTQTLLPALTAAGYEYWLDWGTLLGAEREGGMIAHDYDADVGMRESEFQRLKNEWSFRPEFRGLRLTREPDGLYRVRQGLGWVDVFRYDDATPGSMSMISMANSRHSCKCAGTGHQVHPSTVFPLKRVLFGAAAAFAPGDTANYLTHLYGADWMTPRKNLVAHIMTLFPRQKRG